jgi:spermidine/putrescine transport system substrate-binding protein
VHAWDGWCNFGITENPAIKFMIPKEGSDLFVDTMVVTAVSEHKDAAHAFINYVLRPDVHASIMAFTLYKVPNEKAVEVLDKSLLTTYPNLAIPSEVLFQQEQIRDLGDKQKEFTRVVTEILAAQ